jgi:hypothetical protein
MCTRIVLTIFFLSSLSVNCLAGETPKSHTPAEKDGFVLFPGGSQADGLERQRVVPLLSLPALAMEMPHGATANTTRDEYIGWVLRAIDRAGIRRVVLVGHSGGGLIVPQIAIKAPERIRRQFYLFNTERAHRTTCYHRGQQHPAHAYGVAREAKLETTVGEA